MLSCTTWSSQSTEDDGNLSRRQWRFHLKTFQCPLMIKEVGGTYLNYLQNIATINCSVPGNDGHVWEPMRAGAKRFMLIVYLVWHYILGKPKQYIEHPVEHPKSDLEMAKAKIFSSQRMLQFDVQTRLWFSGTTFSSIVLGLLLLFTTAQILGYLLCAVGQLYNCILEQNPIPPSMHW